MIKPTGKVKNGGIGLPLDLQERLTADAARIPRSNKSALGRDLIIFAYRIIEQFNLTPKEVSDDIHYTESRETVYTDPLQFGRDLTEFRRNTGYDLVTSIQRFSVQGVGQMRTFGFHDIERYLEEKKREKASQEQEKKRA